MAQQKTYSFPGVDGKEVTKTLAAPNNGNVIGMLTLLGVNSFKELFSAEHVMDVAAIKLDIGVDLDTLKKALDFCLAEGTEGIKFDGLDLRLSDGVIQDFFDQRSKKLLERLSS